MIKSPRTRSLPFQQRPLFDRVAWNAAVHRGGPFKPSGRGGNWATKTQQTPGGYEVLRRVFGHDRDCYGRWLCFLVKWPVGPHPATASPGDQSHGTGLLHDLEGLADYTVLTAVDFLFSTIRAMAPDCDWSWLRLVSLNLRRRGPRSRPKHQRIIDIKRIFDTGLALLVEADAIAHRRQRAAAFRNGLMLALLASRSLRRGNFAVTTHRQSIDLNPAALRQRPRPARYGLGSCWHSV